MTTWEHAVSVLRIKKEGFAISRKDLLQGLEKESLSALEELGGNGWELVSVVPMAMGTVGMFSNSKGSTDSLLAFFKRQKN